MLPRYLTSENGIGVTMHELTFSELVVEGRYLLELQSDKVTKLHKYREVTQGIGLYLYCSYYSRDNNKWVLSLSK